VKVLDPIWTTAYITRNHGYLVYDTLFGTDENQQIQPQMIERTRVSSDGMRYVFTLRDGLRWHDGKPVRSEDCVESLKRLGEERSVWSTPLCKYRWAAQVGGCSQDSLCRWHVLQAATHPLANLNGPEPMTSLIGLSGGVDAICAGIINGTLLAGLPRASSTGPNGAARSSANVLLSTGATLAKPAPDNAGCTAGLAKSADSHQVPGLAGQTSPSLSI
jgi:hypothetical protein